MQSKKWGMDPLSRIRNTLFIVVLTTSMTVNAAAQNYSEAIVITEKDHVLSARAIMIKTPPESTAPVKPRVFTTTYDELTTVREKAAPLRVDKPTKHHHSATYRNTDFTIK